ncbi:MAG: MlaD family protein [Candidatus Aureabacteria bacterium]|nr:MlaD family protein [Candidatus Auribacterota bacterium]
MRDTTFKFRFVNEITGAFVLLAIAVLIAGIFMAGRAQGLFEPKFRLHAIFQAQEGTYGLKKGSEVRILNTAAGSVTHIRPTAEGTIEAAFELKSSFHGFVRTDSVAVVRKTLIVTGDSYVDISIGNLHEPLMSDGSLIPCTPDKGITEQAQLILEELRTRALPTLEKLNAVLDELPALTEQTRKTLHEHEVLLQALSREDIHGQLAQFRDTMRTTQVLFEGLQRHWLFRGYMQNPKSASSTATAVQTLPSVGELPPIPGK